MNKLIIISLVLLLIVVSIAYFFEIKETPTQLKINHPYKEKIPLYYNIDNSEQPLIYENGTYKEVLING